MKKILLSAIIVVFALNVNAQFGARAGVSFTSAKLSDEGALNTENISSFYVGFFGVFDLGEKLKIRPEINYSSAEFDGVIKGDFDQIRIPLLLQIGLGKKLAVMAGPSVGIRLNPADDNKSFNFGIDTGVALSLGEKFLVEARYNLGVSNMLEDAGIGIDKELKMMGLQVGAGFKF